MKLFFMFLFLSFQCCYPTLAAECDNVVCPKPKLECNYPRITVHLPNPKNKCCNITECICEGTTYRLSSSQSTKIQMETFNRRYTNCTLIDGNLEIVYINSNKMEVLDSTKYIRIVTGYVLIALNKISVIDLSSLRLIRGEQLFRESLGTCNSSANLGMRGYSFYVTSNLGGSGSSLREIRMPSLTEIMAGDVRVNDNDNLCFINTIKWDGEILNSNEQNVDIVMSNKVTCPACSSNCVNSNVDSDTHCWGPTNDMCQSFFKSSCPNCPNRCNKNGRCCHSYCAGGCADSKPGVIAACHTCKILNNFGECLQKCPSNFDAQPNEPVVVETQKRYQLSRYCVPKCPASRRVLEQDAICVLTCPEGYYEESRTCIKCTPGKCNHICYGLGTGMGPLKNDDVIHVNNIKYFHKNCTIIEGSLVFRETTFSGDNHCKIPGMNEEMLDVFENVEEITGYLGIEYWSSPNLCVFKNLKRIHGNKLRMMQYSLLIITDKKYLRELCLNSLEEIKAGNIALVNNRGLCHTQTLNWNKIFQYSDQTKLVRRSAVRSCPPCSSYCDSRDGCWGREDYQCVTCSNYTDYTNEFGQFTNEWVIDPDSGNAMPGHNVTTCVPVCDVKKGIYTTADHKCFPCDSQCNSTCTGPGPTNCFADPRYSYSHGCRHVMYNGKCVEECPQTHYPDGKFVCRPCSPGCIDGGCTGPEDSYSDRGCTKCYMKYDESNEWYLYHGVQCQACIENLREQKCAQGCTFSNSTQIYKCYEDPLQYYTYIIITVCVLCLIIAFVIVLFRCRNTVRRMKKHIGDKMIGDTNQPNEFESPLTPSGNAPNRAQLRIVKEDELALGKTLGSGAFGAVYKAVWTSMYIENQRIQLPVAVKKLKDVSNCNEIMDEAYLMASVDNPYLVRLLGICMTEQVSLITQLMPLGSLLEYVRDNTDSIGSRRMLVWCTQIAKGMQYLEEKHLVHRDLAARNVLVKTPNHVKITDFGLAKMLNNDQSVYFAEGGKLPIKWLAIECITERQFSHQSDVWAFGVTCWEIFTFGERPYEGVSANQVFSLLERGQRLNQPTICTIEVYMILVKCWMVNPENRPRFKELVEEYTKMFNDHTRYIVIKDDPTHNMMSPSAEDESRFFRQLLEEDETNVDGNLMTDDPDHYLLSLQNGHEALYQNQSVVDQMQSVGANSVPASVHTSGSNRGGRLFSRQTPSAHMEPVPTRQLGMDPLMENGMLPSTSGRMSDASNHDDVFASSSAGMHAPLVQSKSLTVDMPGSDKGAEGQVRYYHHRTHTAGTGARKNSEENPRYTEDPTTHRSYYFDPSKAIPSQRLVQETMPKSHNLQNNTYLESEEVSPLLRDDITPGTSRLSHKISNVSSRSGKSAAAAPAEYINTQNDHDYLNCGVGGDAMMSDVLLPKGHISREENKTVPGKRQDHRDMTFFTNEEYMATDSGIGEDNHSILSASNGMQQSVEHPHHQFVKQPSRKRQNSSFSSAGSSSNGSMGPLIGGSPAHRVRADSNDLQHEDSASGVVRYKPQPKPRQSLKKNTNLNTGLDNPEYMMLQESTSTAADIPM